MGFAYQILIQFLACARRTLHTDLPTNPVKVMRDITHTLMHRYIRRLHKNIGCIASEGMMETGQTLEGNLMFTHIPYSTI